jgi:predicted CoA-substrate-specific enzyme activase
MGIDAGNLLTKVVLMDGDDLMAFAVSETTGAVAKDTEALVSRVLDEAGIERSRVEQCGVTGSGACMVAGTDFSEDEVTCVSVATGYLLPEINMAVDIGGQSITSMLIDEDGDITNFMRNDKCASGSGRFLEVMSAAVGVPVSGIAAAVEGAEKRVVISSQCGVFAESERPEDIVAGLCDSVASIVAAQARRFSAGDEYTLTGGVARIAPVRDLIVQKLGGTYHEFPFDPALAAAIGAALLAGAN